MAGNIYERPLEPINTSHSYFLKQDSNPNLPPISVMLRGVNLSSTSKFPSWSTPRPYAHKTELSRTERDELREWDAGVQTQIANPETLWSEAEKGGHDGWFVGHPLQEDGMEVHLKRLRAWGFTVVRLIITWEALEHAGPGKYDELYIDYLIRLLRACKANGLRVFVSAHQDVFSRFISGSGAPIWVLQALGLNPRRLHQTGSAVVHSQWAYDGWGGVEGREEASKNDFSTLPDMIWNTNLHRLASRHCFTMFFASEVFAPKCVIDGKPIGQWLREKHVAAYGHLADRIRDAGDLIDTCLIGWDSMNEPHEGFIGLPNLNTFPPSQEFRKGASPTPIQGFRLGVGQSVKDVAYDDFTSLGHKSLGKVDITPPEGKGVWLTRDESREAEATWGWKLGPEWDFWNEQGEGGCPWAGHGVWDEPTGDLLNPTYFVKDTEGEEFDFMQDFWKPHYEMYVNRIRQAQPNAISFLNPPVFGSPPRLSEDFKKGRLALSPHIYDGLTLLGKRRHKFNADAVGLQRGNISMLQAIKIGTTNIKKGLFHQLEELKSDSSKTSGIAENASGKKEYPTLIGELGVPFDMKKTKWLGLAKGPTEKGDYTQSGKAMDELLQGCDGSNTLSYTIWVYEPTNTHEQGDGWNGEDLSLFSYDDLGGDDDVAAMNPPNLSSLIQLGSRGINAWCRPYPFETMGRLREFTFDMKTTKFEVTIHVLSLDDSRLWQSQRDGDEQKPVEEGWTTIYLPFVHYLRSVTAQSEGENRLIGRQGKEGMWLEGVEAIVDLEILEISEGRLEVEGQWGKWYYPLDRERDVTLKFRKWEG